MINQVLAVISVFQDADMIENIRNVYALPPVYILMNHCDTVDSDTNTTADGKDDEEDENEDEDEDYDVEDDDDEEEVEISFYPII